MNTETQHTIKMMRKKYAPRKTRTGKLWYPAGGSDALALTRLLEDAHAEIDRLWDKLLPFMKGKDT